jgi:enterochelin esterase-like enzyme
MEPVAAARVDGRRGPAWLDLPPAEGQWTDLSFARVWSPAVPTDRVLVAHDGPDYDGRASLGHFAAAILAAGRVPPFRLALLPAGERDERYSASAAYTRELATRILPRLTDRPVIGAGASLGALAMLHAQRRHPDLFAGLFLQSGSFFQPRFDSQESGFGRYQRIVRFVGHVLREPSGPALPVVMTCGDEENLANNRDLAGVLRGQGYDVTFAENRDGHDWIGWRNALDPHLTTLLQRVWS